MKKIKNYFMNGLVLLLVLLQFSCDDDVPVENTNALTPDVFFLSLSQVEAAVNASYNQFQIVYQRKFCYW